MTALTNTRHELFVQGVAKGLNATQAYKSAGYEAEGNAAEVSACKLLRHPKVVARLEQLKNRLAAKIDVTLASLIAEAESARVLAMSIDQPSAAVAAIKEKGVLAGLRVEKAERKNINDVRRLTNAELDAEIADALARAPEAERSSRVTH